MRKNDKFQVQSLRKHLYKNRRLKIEVFFYIYIIMILQIYDSKILQLPDTEFFSNLTLTQRNSGLGSSGPNPQQSTGAKFLENENIRNLQKRFLRLIII